MWDFFETVRHRHSIRKFQPDMPVEEAKLHAILESACWAPSAGDLQAYKIYVVRNAAQKQALSDAADNQMFITEAPVSLVFCADAVISERQFGKRGRDLYALQDATIAAAYAQLAVVAAGMASTWIGRFDENAVKNALRLPDTHKAVALLSVGYPAELPAETPRRPLTDVVTYL